MKRFFYILLLFPVFAIAQPPPTATDPLSVDSAHIIYPTDATSGMITNAMSALSDKPSCRLVSNSNVVSLSGTTPSIDSISLVAGDVVLLAAQSSGAFNGPWVVASGSWTRPSWYASGHTTQAFLNVGIHIREGAKFAGSWWRITNTGPFTIDTNSTVWGQTAVISLSGNSIQYLYTTVTDSNIWLGPSVGSGGTGGFNAAIGNNVLNSNTTGTDNVGIGFHVLDHNQSGSYNLGLGSSALTTNVSGTGNTAYGRQALLQNNTGNFNIAIGYQSGFHLNTAGDGNNVLIGSGTAFDLIGGVRNTIIGSNLNGFPAIISDSILIGSSGNTRIYVNSAGDTGIGVIPAATPTPTIAVAAKLHVVKTAEQLRVGYDGANYYSTTVSSLGSVTFDAVGGVPAGSPTPMPVFIFNDPTAISRLPVGSATPTPLPGNGIFYVAPDGSFKYISPADGPGGSHTATIANQ